MRVLLIEDTVGLGQAVREQIADDGHAVDWVQRIDHAQSSVRTTHYDLILLDLMLPDGQGLDFLRKRRAAGDVTPVIILTARDQISDRIAGLNAGADDYLVKPFDLFELSARWLPWRGVTAATPTRRCNWAICRSTCRRARCSGWVCWWI